MSDIEFEYELENNILIVEATVSPGRPARINCLPEDAYPAEDPEIEIGDCHIKVVDGERGGAFDPEGLFYRKWRKTELTSVMDDLRDKAWEEFERQVQ